MKPTQDKARYNNFILQGSILALAGVLVRILGLAKRIPLPYIIGDVGNSYYSVAYEIYNIVFIISAYGIPLSVSKLVSAKVSKGEYRNADKIFKCALTFAFVTGIITSSLVFIFSDNLSAFLEEPMSSMALKTLSPLLFVVCIMGVFRGYFQGMGTMVPTATSQLIEQIVLIAVGLSGAYILTGYGEKVGLILHNENYKYAYGAAGATLGCTVGAIAGCIFLILLYRSNLKNLNKKIYRDPTTKIDGTRDVFRVLILTILPVIASNFVNYISNLLDMYFHNHIMVEKGLESIKSVNWGIYSGKYLVLINVPIAIATAMGASSVPTISALMKLDELDEVKEKIASVIRVTMIISIPCAFGLMALAPSLMWFLFSTTNTTGPTLLRLGAMGVVLFSFSTLTNGILQGMSKLNKPIIHGVISLGLHLTILISLLKFTDLNIYAVAISNNFFSLFICIMNIISISRILKYRQEIKKTFILPFISAAVMGTVIYFLDVLFTKNGYSRGLTLINIIIGVLIYFVLMLLTKAITKTEFEAMPGCMKVYRILHKLHLCN